MKHSRVSRRTGQTDHNCGFCRKKEDEVGVLSFATKPEMQKPAGPGNTDAKGTGAAVAALGSSATSLARDHHSC